MRSSAFWATSKSGSDSSAGTALLRCVSGHSNLYVPRPRPPAVKITPPRRPRYRESAASHFPAGVRQDVPLARKLAQPKRNQLPLQQGDRRVGVDPPGIAAATQPALLQPKARVDARKAGAEFPPVGHESQDFKLRCR